MPLRIIFMGTPEFAVPVLNAVAAQGHDIVAVYTQPPRPAGRRGLKMRESPVHHQADLLGIPVYTPASLKSDEEQTAFCAFDADAAVVVAYGLLLPEAVLNGTRLGCFNVHASLLPRWRGAAPIQRAIMAGDRETGVSIMKMDRGLDTGAVALEERIAIRSGMTAGDIHDALIPVGADLMVRTLAALERGSLILQDQSEDGVTYAKKIDKAEARIDWARPAAEVDRTIRGLSPFPGAWCEADIGNGLERIKLLRSSVADGTGVPGCLIGNGLKIACGAGAVNIHLLQKAGGKPMDAETFLRGNSLAPNSQLS